MKKTFVLLSTIKKRAKQLQKQQSLKWNQALDESSREFGFSNFKNYKNITESNVREYKTSLDDFLKTISLESNVSNKMEQAVAFIQKYNAPFKDTLDILKIFQDSNELGEHPDFEWIDDVHFVCDKLNLMKDEIQTYLLNDFLTGETEDSIHDFYPYFSAKKLSLSDVTYEIRKDTLYADGNYHLTIEGESDEPPHDLQEQGLEGSFGVTIDRNKKMTLEHSDIGDATGGHSRGGPFTKEEIESYYRRLPEERERFDDIQVLDDSKYGEIKRCLASNEPLTGKTLEVALSLVDVYGDDEQSKFLKSIGVKMKAGQPLDNYEQHILVDVLMLHTQLGA